MSGNNGTDSGGHEHRMRTDTDLYGYVPSKAIAIIFIALFVLSTFTHLAQAIKHRTWFMIGTACLCGAVELLGWAARAWSSSSPQASLPFEIQIVATILAPTPLLAATFVISGRIIRRLGQQYSRLGPRVYTAIFTTCDVVALAIQGYGGGVAASAADLAGANKGANIMLIGIVFQLVIIIIFLATALDFFVRYNRDTRNRGSKSAYLQRAGETSGVYTPKLRLMTMALAANLACLFIRSVYRTIELAGGWEGAILRTQVYFVIFDAAMVVLAICATNVIHPGVYLVEHTPLSAVSMERLAGESYDNLHV